MSPQQLTLFKTPAKYRRSALEFPKCCVIADAVRRFLSDGWEWTHLPFGELRAPGTAARLKRMGVNRGWPDYLFVSPTGLHHYVEVKRDGEKPGPDQVRLGELFQRNGIPYLLSSDVGEILRVLKAWGVVRSTVRF